MELHIREAQENDLPALLGLYAQLGMDDGKVLSPEKARDIFLRIRSYPDYSIYLAEAGGRVLGTFALLIMDNLGHMGTPSAIIEDVVVAENSRGMGLGKQMMEFATRLCREKGCYKFFFSSNIKREAAHGFYEKLGFKIHGYSFFTDLRPANE